MKLTIDRDRCEGYGLCAEAAPHLMHLDDQGELVLDQVEVPDSSAVNAEEAVRVCPVAALKAR
ncbi:ferredoxin [Pseudonocardia kujensis]|uniref:ferredoxin n=1 Tax=Pseudonocardia kujensis TaxID=1128675 RepID=UPI001E58F449|nr:ferredoxin [Pseudonocardia kujensis]MCE0763323.1 ferredoxin [Pseudonocardia kujensis]